MSAIIKSGNLADLVGVRPFAAPLPAPALAATSRQDEERERLRRTVTALEGELRQRDIAIEVLQADVKQAFEDGTAKGREAGLAEAHDRQSDRLAQLEAAAQKAADEIAAKLVGLERLAALLARDCVAKILGDADDRAEFIARIIGVQTAKIDQAMLLGIDVARADFPDDAALAALAERLRPLSVALNASEALRTGGCVMTLRLGRMVVGLDQQWPALSDVLDEMATPEAAP